MGNNWNSRTLCFYYKNCITKLIKIQKISLIQIMKEISWLVLLVITLWKSEIDWEYMKWEDCSTVYIKWIPLSIVLMVALRSSRLETFRIKKKPLLWRNNILYDSIIWRYIKFNSIFINYLKKPLLFTQLLLDFLI